MRHYTTSKNVTNLSCYNFDANEPVLIIFGRNISEKVSNQKMLIFPPHIASASALSGE